MADILNEFDEGTVTLIDGTAVTPLECEIAYLNGDLNLEGFKGGGSFDAQVYQTRRTVHAIRKGARTFPVISFSAQAGVFSKATGSTAIDFLHGVTGTDYASRVSTLSTSDFFHCDVKFTNSEAEELLFEDCLVEWTHAEGDPNTFSFTATCYGAHPFDEE